MKKNMRKLIKSLVIIIIIALLALAVWFGWHTYKTKYAPHNQPGQPEVEDIAGFEKLCNSNGGTWAENLPGNFPGCIFAGVQYLNGTELKDAIGKIEQKQKSEEIAQFKNLCTTNKGLWTDETTTGGDVKCNFNGIDYITEPELVGAAINAAVPTEAAKK